MRKTWYNRYNETLEEEKPSFCIRTAELQSCLNLYFMLIINYSNIKYISREGAYE